MDGYTNDIIRILDKYLVMDIGRNMDLVIQVVLRDKAHFDMNPKLSMQENTADMFVERIENRDNESFTLCLTETNIRMDDQLKKLIRWRKVKRTDKTHRIVVKRGENTVAPYISPESYIILRNTVRRYDAYEQGLRKTIDFLNGRERNQEADDFFRECEQTAKRNGIDLLLFLRNL